MEKYPILWHCVNGEVVMFCKRIVSSCIAVVLCLSLLSTGVFASQELENTAQTTEAVAASEDGASSEVQLSEDSGA
jgi:hypothetical protein